MVILDSSVAVRAALAVDVSNKFLKAVSQQSAMFSPSIYLSETANAVWKEVRFNSLPIDLIPYIRQTLMSMTMLVPDEDYIEAALDIAIKNEHPVYDCLFIALSRDLQAPILTADERLRRKFPEDQFLEI